MTTPQPSAHTLTVGELFPTVGAAVYVNHLPHQADTPFHDHDFLEIAIVQSGSGCHRNLRDTVPLEAGDVLLVTPGQWHGYTACADLWLYNLDVAHALLVNELGWLNHDPLLATLLAPRRSGVAPGQQIIIGRLAPEARQQVFTACERIMALQNSGDHLRIRAEVIGHLCIALGAIARNLPPRKQATTRIDDGIRDLITAMEADLDHDWSLDELAQRLHVTPAYCVRRFNRAVGVAPLAWLTRRRTEVAAVLLVTTDSPIGEIARRVGWNDANYFARRFRTVFGQNPTTYRQHGPRATAHGHAAARHFANSDP